jgi:hypothetical protein
MTLALLRLKVVTTLIAPYLNKGHSDYSDNWRTSRALALFLHKLKTSSCDTVQDNKKVGMPPFVTKAFAK